MGFLKDTMSSLKRIPQHARRLKALLSDHEIHTVADLRRAAKEPSFQNGLATLGEDILKAEGGKLTGTLILSMIALAMGGVGIAAGGGAIGLPLLVILAPAGFLGGQELDSEGYSKAIVERLKKLICQGTTQP